MEMWMQHFMCHHWKTEIWGETKNPWKRLFAECGQCFGPKTLCSLQIGKPPPLMIWLCLPCERAKPSLTEIIESNSMKEPPQ